MAEHVPKWSDAQVYAQFGQPETEKVRTCNGQQRGPHVPAELVAFINNEAITDESILQENIVVNDFGQSYAIASPPADHDPATAMHYAPPETRFESRSGLVWKFGCAIFEFRAGAPHILGR